MFRSTVMGTYPRIGGGPGQQRLRRALSKRDRGAISDEELRSVEESVIEEVVREQSEAGVDLITDGQVTWYDAPSHFASRLSGFQIGPLERYFDTNTYYRQPRPGGEIRWTEAITVDDWRVASRVSDTPVKAVLLGPHSLASVSDVPPARRAATARALALALALEIRALREAGVTYLQIDEPCLATDGIPDEYPDLADDLLRHRGDLHTTLAVTFGSVDVSGILGLPFDAFALDLVQGRAAIKALRKAGTEKGVAFGLVDARNTKADSAAKIAETVLSFRDAVPLEKSFLSPSNGLEFLPRRKAKQKLGTLVSATAKVREALA